MSAVNTKQEADSETHRHKAAWYCIAGHNQRKANTNARQVLTALKHNTHGTRVAGDTQYSQWGCPIPHTRTSNDFISGHSFSLKSKVSRKLPALSLMGSTRASTSLNSPVLGVAVVAFDTYHKYNGITGRLAGTIPVDQQHTPPCMLLQTTTMQPTPQRHTGRGSSGPQTPPRGCSQTQAGT